MIGGAGSPSCQPMMPGWSGPARWNWLRGGDGVAEVDARIENVGVGWRWCRCPGRPPAATQFASLSCRRASRPCIAEPLSALGRSRSSTTIPDDPVATREGSLAGFCGCASQQEAVPAARAWMRSSIGVRGRRIRRRSRLRLCGGFRSLIGDPAAASDVAHEHGFRPVLALDRPPRQSRTHVTTDRRIELDLRRRHRRSLVSAGHAMLPPPQEISRSSVLARPAAQAPWP